MCECLCPRKDAQQVYLSLPHFHFVQQRAFLCEQLLSVKALPDHSFMCHFPECTTFIGPHDNRPGKQRKERDACQSGYIQAVPGGDSSAHDTSVTRHRETLSSLLPCCRLMVVKLARVWALVWF